MNDNSSSKVPGSNADLIIISPEELAKLGLLQDLSSIVSSPSSQKKHAKHNSSSTASSSTTLKFSPASENCELSARKRKYSRSSKNETFKMPEASPTLKKSPVTSKLTPKPKIFPEQHSPHSSKSNSLDPTPVDPLKKPVLKRNLEKMKKIVSETIISHSIKKGVKVISNDAVSFSTKELNDLIRKAPKQKNDMQMEGMRFSGKKLEITDTSPIEESKEVSCKKPHEHSNVNDFDEEEFSKGVENAKVSNQDEKLPLTPKFDLVNYSSNIPVAKTSCIATNTLDPSLPDISSKNSIEQSDSPEQNKSNLKFGQDEACTKDFANVEQDLETDIKKPFSSPIKTVPSAVEETQFSDKNINKLDRMFNKRRRYKRPSIVGRKNEAEANQQKCMLDPNTSVEVDTKNYVDEQGSSMISVLNENKDPEYSDDVNEEVKEVTRKSMSFPNELEKSNSEENNYLRLEEDINSENTILENKLEASSNNRTLQVERKRDKARNQSTDSNQIAETSIIPVQNPEELNAFSGSKEEKDSENVVREGIEECASISSQPEESIVITSGKNSNSAKSIAETAKKDITDTKRVDLLPSPNKNVIYVRRRRQVKKPILVKKKNDEAENHNSNDILDASTTDTLELNRSSNIPVNNVGYSVSEKKQDYLSISVESEASAVNPTRESENSSVKKTATKLEESEEQSREAPKLCSLLEQKENATKTVPVETIASQNENLPCSERGSLATKPSLDHAVTNCSTDILVAGCSTKKHLGYSVSEEQQETSSISLSYQDEKSEDYVKKVSKDFQDPVKKEVAEVLKELSEERLDKGSKSPKVIGEIKQEDNSTKLKEVERNVNLPFRKRKSRTNKPLLDEAVTDHPADVSNAGASGITSNIRELNRSLENPTKKNGKQSVSEKGLESSSVLFPDKESENSIENLIKDSEDFVKTPSTIGKDEFQKERKDCGSLSNEREGSAENFPIAAKQVEPITCHNENTPSRRRRAIKKPFLLKRSRGTAPDHTPEKESSSSVLEDSENASKKLHFDGKKSRTETATEIENKSLQISEDLKEEAPIERGGIDRIPSPQDTISLPVKVVKKNGRPRKKTFEGSPSKKSKDPIKTPKKLSCQSKDAEKTDEKFDQPFSPDISFTTEHFSTPLKKRGRPKKQTIDGEAIKGKSKRNNIEIETIAEISSHIDSIANDTTVNNSLLSSTNDESVDETDVSVSEKKSSSQADTEEENKTENEMGKGSMYIVDEGSESSGQIVSYTTDLVKPAKKRGRSKKTNVILESSISNPARNSKRGRKPKKLDSPEWESNEDNITEQGQITQGQSISFDADHDLIPEKTFGDSSRKKDIRTVDSLLNSDLNEEENIEIINKIESSLGGEKNSSMNEKEDAVLEKGNESNEPFLSDTSYLAKPAKKRGRSSSNKLANVTSESFISNPVGESKRDRKSKKHDSSECESNEDNITEQIRITQGQSLSFDTEDDLIPEKTYGESSRKKYMKTVDSQINSGSNEEEHIEINKIESSLGGEQNSSINKKADPVLDRGNESNVPILSDTSDLVKSAKKRGRSSSDKLANVTIESSISNPVGKSKRGRKPKKTDSSEWQSNEDNITEQRRITQSQSLSFDTDHDLIPEKTLGDSSRKIYMRTVDSQINSDLDKEKTIGINKLESGLGGEQNSSTNEKADAVLGKGNEPIGQDISDADGPIEPVKKRGRPRKSVGAADVNSEPTVSYATGESRSGRKRKIIDYLELELNGNNFIEPRQTAGDQSQFSVTDDNLTPKKKARVDSRKKKHDTLNINIISDLIEKEHIESDNMTAEGNESERTTVVKSEDSTSGVKNCPVDSVGGTEDAEISEEGSTNSKSGAKTKNRKSALKGTYIWNGHTSEMMNSVFSAAFGGEQSTSAASSSTSSQEPVEKGKRGRRKKFGDSVRDAKFPDDSPVSCCVCSEVLLNRDWYVHNATKHYNLAWRKGELALNLDDDAAVKQRLKLLLPKNKILICSNCSLPCEGVDRFMIHREECSGILVNGLVTCAVCNSQSDRESWLAHKLKMHNNLAWRVGDPPLDLNDQNYVLSVLNAIYKLRKPLYCDKCGQTKKSVVGYLSHRAQCGVNLEDVKVECKQCGKKVLPVSMPTHIKLVHETSRENSFSSDYFDVDSNATNHKRKAAKNALRIIDFFTKNTDNEKGSQSKPYVTNPNDFKEQEFAIPLLEKELQKLMTIKCKFHDCTFTADQIEPLLDHMNSCASKPGEFHVCTICFVIRSVEEEIRSHVTEVHDLFLPNPDDEEEEGFNSGEENEGIARAIKRKLDASKLQKDTNFKVKPYCVSQFSSKPKNALFCGAFDFTWEFCSEHYSQPLLYDNLRQSINEWSVLWTESLEKYLPKAECSCDVARKMVRDIENVVGEEFQFKRYDFFEVVREDVHTTIFCGGPINALAWAPTPHTSRTANQILAVAAGNDFESKYKVNSTYEEPCVIQFWDFGRLANRGPYPEPSLMLGLAVDYGPVWHLEWCPSGCYDQVDSGRVGLLAVAGSVPTVCVYSIPMVTDDEKRELIYRGKPLLKLQFVNNKNGTFETNMFPTRISWSKASGHKHIAVGYTDGMVALFDLQTPSTFFKYRDDDGIVNLLPYKVFQAHLHYISVLSLIHYGGGDRWLLTGSFDKDVHMHDLYNDTKETVHKRKTITDGTWLTNWLSYVVTSDESSSTNNLCHTTLHAHRNYLFEPTTICSSQATLNSITSSDWLNGLVQVSALGEIFAFFPHQLMYSFDSVKNLHLNKFLTGYTKLVDKHKPADVRVVEEADKKRILTPIPRGRNESEMDESTHRAYHYFEPITYDGADKKYGLVFCDFKMDSFADFSESFQRKLSGRHEELDPSRPNLYSLQSANKVSANPNCQASLYFATGYQAGFVRVSYLKFLENDPQVNKSV